MKTLNAPKRNDGKTVMVIVVNNVLPRGHVSHRGGSGAHAYKGDRRMGTRNARNSEAMKD